MAGQGQNQPWPDIPLIESQWNLTFDPPVAYSSETGRSYVDLTYESTLGDYNPGPDRKVRVAPDFTSEALTPLIGRNKVAIGRLWSTGVFGLILNPDSKVYSAVKLFRADLVSSQDAFESNVPYLFWNKFSPKPYPLSATADWVLYAPSRSLYIPKTAAQLRDWIKTQNARANEPDGMDTQPSRGYNGSGISLYQEAINEAEQRLAGNESLTVSYTELKLSDYLTIKIPSSTTSANFASRVIEALRASGVPEAELRQFRQQFINQAIRAAMGTSGPTISGGNTGSISGGTTGSSGGSVPPSNETVTPSISLPIQTIIRIPSGARLVDTTGPGGNPASSVRPSFRQAYIDGSGQNAEDIFYFDYVPSTISYTLGGSVWNEIPRTFNSPLVEWTSYGLTRIQMTFLIAGTRLESQTNGSRIVPDGLNVDIEDRIQLLRRMATRPSPIVVYGLDDIFNIQLQQAQATGIPCNWAITDLSITAKRRTEGPPSLISVAQVNLSLIEFPVETVAASPLGTLKLQIPSPDTHGGNDGQNAIRPDLWTAFLSTPIQNVLLIDGRPTG